MTYKAKHHESHKLRLIYMCMTEFISAHNKNQAMANCGWEAYIYTNAQKYSVLEDATPNQNK